MALETKHVVVAFVRALYDSRMYQWFSAQFRYPVLLFIVGMTTSALADEGMWLFNEPPLKQLKEKYQFEPTPQWLEHLQKASVRFNSGGSGSVCFRKRTLPHTHPL